MRGHGISGLGGLERARDVPRRLADDLESTFGGETQPPLPLVVKQRLALDEFRDRPGVAEHVP